MSQDPYAPPKAPVADVSVDSSPARPWQIRLAVALGVVILVLTQLEIANNVFEAIPGGAREAAFFAMLIGFLVVIFSLLAWLCWLMWRGYRWARVVFSVLTLLDLLTRIRTVSGDFDQTWYQGGLSVLLGALGVCTLALLFTWPANAWFKTRGGTIAAP